MTAIKLLQRRQGQVAMTVVFYQAPSSGLQMQDGLQQSARSVLCGAAVVVLAAPPHEGCTGEACGRSKSAVYLHQAFAHPDSAAVHSRELCASPRCLSNALT